MFIYFHQRKANYDKGQIAPLMILVLVILIIMAMVTVNLYKVAMDKTYSANSVDAGALAAGSVMANVFNAIASTNADMKKGYNTAFWLINSDVVLGLTWLGLAANSAVWAEAFSGKAIALSYVSPCSAIGYAEEADSALGKTGGLLPTSAIGQTQVATGVITGIIIATSALYTAQLYNYGKIRDTAREGRQNAIEQGHKYLFYNSGAGSRLPESIPEGSLWSKSRVDFSKFMDGIKNADTYRFDWVDGQDRAHFVESKVTTDELDAFDLIVTVSPFPVLIGLLVGARVATTAATASLKAAEFALGALGGATSTLKIACAAQMCYLANPEPITKAHCFAAWMAASKGAMAALADSMALSAAALGMIIGAAAATGAAGAGLLPNRGNPVRDDNMGVSVVSFIICWIDDIIHNRRLRVESALSQEGGDLGLAKTEYPVVQSYSVVNFKGNGKIAPAESKDLSFDASIIETDVVGKNE